MDSDTVHPHLTSLPATDIHTVEPLYNRLILRQIPTLQGKVAIMSLLHTFTVFLVPSVQGSVKRELFEDPNYFVAGRIHCAT